MVRVIEASRAAVHDAPPAPRVDESTLSIEREAALRGAELCGVAKDHLGAHWDRQRDNVLGLVRRMDAPETRAHWVRDQVARFVDTLGLDEAAASALAIDYADLARPHLAAAAAAASANPPDTARLLETAKQLYAGEDRLVSTRFGPDAAATVRRAHARGRTTVLALLGRYAGEPWEAATRW